MAIIRTINRNGEILTPKYGKGCFLADNAALVGEVTMGDDCTVWFGTVLRGDVNTITIGNRVNNVTVHGAKICDFALIGMGAVLLDDVVVGKGSIVAAGSVVKKGTIIGDNELWAGAPAVFKKKVDPAQSQEMNVKIAKNYLMYSKWYDYNEEDQK